MALDMGNGGMGGCPDVEVEGILLLMRRAMQTNINLSNSKKCEICWHTTC